MWLAIVPLLINNFQAPKFIKEANKVNNNFRDIHRENTWEVQDPKALIMQSSISMKMLVLDMLNELTKFTGIIMGILMDLNSLQYIHTYAREFLLKQ